MTDERSKILTEMNDRSREVFRRVVESYLDNGDPVGSRTLTRSLSEKVSAATIRNVMQDLEYLGLLDSPHTSAGRVPTQLGLRMFVDGLMEVSTVSVEDREAIEATTTGNEAGVSSLLDRVGQALSGITHGASLVLTPKREAPIRHIEFVSLGADRALVVLVFADGHVENRVFMPPMGHTPSAMREAGNFLNAMAEGRTVSELRGHIVGEIARRRSRSSTAPPAIWWSGGWPSGMNSGETTEQAHRSRPGQPLEQADQADLDRIRSFSTTLSASATSRNSSNWRKRAKGCAFLSARRTSYSHFRVPLWWCLPI